MEGWTSKRSHNGWNPFMQRRYLVLQTSGHGQAQPLLRYYSGATAFQSQLKGEVPLANACVENVGRELRVTAEDDKHGERAREWMFVCESESAAAAWAYAIKAAAAETPKAATPGAEPATPTRQQRNETLSWRVRKSFGERAELLPLVRLAVERRARERGASFEGATPTKAKATFAAAAREVLQATRLRKGKLARASISGGALGESVKTFAAADRNGDGAVDSAELVSLARETFQLNFSSQQAEQLIYKYDSDRDGALNAVEFARMLLDGGLVKDSTPDALATSIDGTSTLHQDVMNLGIARDGEAGEAQLRAMFAMFDTDSSGRVDPTELGGALDALGLGNSATPEELAAMVSEFEIEAHGAGADVSGLSFEGFKLMMADA